MVPAQGRRRTGVPDRPQGDDGKPVRKLLKHFTLIAVVGLVTAAAAFHFYGSSSRLSPEMRSGTELYLVSRTPAETPPGAYSLVTYNLGWLSGMTNTMPVARPQRLFERNLDRAAGLLKRLDADVVALQAVDFDSARSFDANQMDGLALGGGYQYGAWAVDWDKRYVPLPMMPVVAQFGRMMSGQVVLSRRNITGQQIHELADPGGRPFWELAYSRRCLAQVVTIGLNRPVTVINVRLDAHDTAVREEQARQIVRLAKRFLGKTPLLVIGDFGTIPSYASIRDSFPEDSELTYDGDDTWRILTEELGLREAFPKPDSMTEEARAYTFTPQSPDRKVDHIFYDPRTIEPLSRRVVTEAGDISNHLPVLMTFSLKD